MWTKQHRARHEPSLKDMVSRWAEKKVARWLEQADPPRSEAATLAVVRAIAWHLRIGGPWWPCRRTCRRGGRCMAGSDAGWSSACSTA